MADGGSNDGSLEIINEFCSSDKRFRLVSTADNGQPDAIAKAFYGASGDIYCFLNADDCFICSDALSSVVTAFTSYPKVDIVSFTGYYIDASSNYLRPVKLRYHPLDTFALMKYRTAVLQPATFWRRVVHETLPMRSGSHYTFDSIFFYQAYLIFSWIELSKPVAGHRLHGANKSASVRFERIRELAEFEEIKFGVGSWRAVYLRLVAAFVRLLSRIPVVGGFLNKVVYLCVNSLSFISCYRIPSV